MELVKTVGAEPTKKSKKAKKVQPIIEGKTYFHYSVKDIEKRGKTETRRVTIGAVLKDGVMTFGRAECSPKDTFTKKLARLITTARAIKKPINRVEINSSQIAGKVFIEVAIQLV